MTDHRESTAPSRGGGPHERRRPKTASHRSADRICDVLAAICLLVALPALVLAGWFNSDVEDVAFPVDPVQLLPVGIVALVAAMFLLGLAHDDEADRPRIVLFPVAAFFIAFGLGQFGHTVLRQAPSSTAAVVLGVAAIVVGAGIGVAAEFRARHLRTIRRISERAEREGLDAVGAVTAIKCYSENEVDVWRTTITFTAADGRTHDFRRVFRDDEPKVGQKVGVRYLPDHPGHAAVVRPRSGRPTWSPGR